MKAYHTFGPVYSPQSRILILGSFPSVKSREQGFYYGHPQNRFWKLIAALLGESEPHSIEEKKALLLRRHIALWDVIESCSIEGSSDQSIRDVVCNPLQQVTDCSEIRQVFANGKKAFDLYEKYGKEKTGLPCQKLPSTSPANAAYSMEKLREAWSVIVEFL